MPPAGGVSERVVNLVWGPTYYSSSRRIVRQPNGIENLNEQELKRGRLARGGTGSLCTFLH